MGRRWALFNDGPSGVFWLGVFNTYDECLGRAMRMIYNDEECYTGCTFKIGRPQEANGGSGEVIEVEMARDGASPTYEYYYILASDVAEDTDGD